MAGNITIRTLVSKLVLQGFKEAVGGLKKYRDDWNVTAKVVDAAASAVERSASRASAAMAGMASGAAAVRQAAGSGGGGGGSSRSRVTRDPLDAAIGRANRQARDEARAQQRTDAQRSSIARGEARQAGLAAGSARVNEATATLGRFATASDRAKAKVADLTTTVTNNRKAMADLREQALKTGDADGALAAKMQGLSVATGRAQIELAAARRELRAVDGGLIDAVKNAANLSGKFDALKVAAGNLLSGAVTGGVDLLKRGLVGSAESAMDFEKALVDVAKVAKSADLTKDGLLDPRVKQGIKDVSKELGVMPTEVAELTAQITAAFSGKTDIVALASDVTKIGVAWDISGKQAGEYFKQTSAGLQLNADETKALFGSINQLGNELGIKSSEIAEAMTRSAGVLKGANISGETGAALNATLIKAGASAEVAATGVRTFIARLGAGEAATDKQVKAFNALGLSAKDVAKNLASGDAAKAEGQIREVVAALVKMGEVSPDKRMATLIELFGSESIGSIGAAASAVDTLASSFAIAGDKGAALTSVQAEYDRVSNTTAARVEKLKANVGVLAVEFGEALLPHIDKVVAFLTSPEGQQWGRDAVEKAASAVSDLASVLGTVVSGVSSLVDVFGGAEVAVGAFGLAVAALAGPWGIAAAAAAAALGGMIAGIGKVASMIPALNAAVMGIGSSDEVTSRNLENLRKTMAEDDQRSLGEVTDLDRARRVLGQDGGPAPIDTPTGPSFGYGALPMGSGPPPPGSEAANDGGGASVERFNALLAKRAKGQLRPSEAKELRSLSKALDMPIPRAGGGHKATEMDKRLAALDPGLAGILRQGGEADAGGDLKVSSDPLSRAVYARATGTGGGGSGGLGPGPNITNNIYNNNVTVTQNIDASSNAPAVENLRQAGSEAAQQVGNVTFTGLQRVLTLRTSGGRMA